MNGDDLKGPAFIAARSALVTGMSSQRLRVGAAYDKYHLRATASTPASSSSSTPIRDPVLAWPLLIGAAHFTGDRSEGICRRPGVVVEPDEQVNNSERATNWPLRFSGTNQPMLDNTAVAHTTHQLHALHSFLNAPISHPPSRGRLPRRTCFQLAGSLALVGRFGFSSTR